MRHRLPMRAAVRAATLLSGMIALGGARWALSQPTAVDPVGSPSWILDMFYAKPAFPDEASYLTADFAAHYGGQPTVGAHLPFHAHVQSREVGRDAAGTLYATTIRDDAHVQEWYTHFRLESGRWRIAAVRTLRLPSMYFTTLDSLSHAPALPDSLSRDLTLMRLTVSSDSMLRAHLHENAAAFRTLARAFGQRSDLVAVDDRGHALPEGMSAGTLPSLLHRAGARAAIRPRELPGCFEFKVGGAHTPERESAVGYFFAPPGCVVPEPALNGYMYIERVLPGWYVFKSQVAVEGGSG